MTTDAFVKHCLAVCMHGFANEFAWQAWLKARQARIDSLPRSQRERIMAARTNSGPKELR